MKTAMTKHVVSTALDRLIWDLEDSAQFWQRCADDAKRALKERPRAERRSRLTKIAEDETSALLCRELIAAIKNHRSPRSHRDRGR